MTIFLKMTMSRNGSGNHYHINSCASSSASYQPGIQNYAMVDQKEQKSMNSSLLPILSMGK